MAKPVRQLVAGPLLAAIVSVLGGCAHSYQATIQQQPPREGEPLALEFVHNLPVVHAKVAGEPVRLIVDLGGHDTMTLTEETIERIPAVTRTGRRHVSRWASGRRSKDDEIVIPELRLGDVTVTDIDGHSIDFGEPRLDSVDGYIGIAILRRFRLLVNYPENIILLPADDSLAELDVTGWTSVEITRRLHTKAAVNDKIVIALWDTGGSHSIIDDDVAELLFGRGTDRTEAALILALILDGEDFGDFEFRVAELRGTFVSLLIGHNFFRRHRVLFDFAQNVAYVEPVSQVPLFIENWS